MRRRSAVARIDEMGKLLGIATRQKSRAPMDRHDAIGISVDAGLDGDLRGRSRGRNVTVLPLEGWEVACRELGCELDWTTRRANLLVEGVDLSASVGARLHIGGVVLEITEECEPCERMEAALAGLRGALRDWRAGVSCRVIQAGEIRNGDAVELRALA